MDERVVSNPAILGGTPVFRGTRIPLEHIVGLLRKGVSESEIEEDYPSLTKADLAVAHAQARQRKRPAKPRKPQELRKTAEAA